MLDFAKEIITTYEGYKGFWLKGLRFNQPFSAQMAYLFLQFFLRELSCTLVFFIGGWSLNCWTDIWWNLPDGRNKQHWMSVWAAHICVARGAGWWLLRLTNQKWVGKGHGGKEPGGIPQESSEVSVKLWAQPWTHDLPLDQLVQKRSPENGLSKNYSTSKNCPLRAQEKVNLLMVSWSWKPVLSQRNQLSFTQKSFWQWVWAVVDYGAKNSPCWQILRTSCRCRPWWVQTPKSSVGEQDRNRGHIEEA